MKQTVNAVSKGHGGGVARSALGYYYGNAAFHYFVWFSDPGRRSALDFVCLGFGVFGGLESTRNNYTSRLGRVSNYPRALRATPPPCPFETAFTVFSIYKFR